MIKSLFDIGSNLTTEGTENEKGTGLGLILCKEFMHQNDVDISVESKKELAQALKFHFRHKPF